MQLRRLAALERKKIEDEYIATIKLIAELEDILANPARVLRIIKDELTRAGAKYAGERRTRVAGRRRPRADRRGPHRRRRRRRHRLGPRLHQAPALATYRRQARGGKGIIGARTVEEDAVAHLLVANTHDWALFFTNRGRVFSSKVHQIPDASRAGQGHPDHQPRGRPGRVRASASWRSSRSPTSRRATTWSWPRARA